MAAIFNSVEANKISIAFAMTIAKDSWGFLKLKISNNKQPYFQLDRIKERLVEKK